MLIAIGLPLLLMAYGQIVMKWRIGAIGQAQPGTLTALGRLLHYLSDPLILSAYAAALLTSVAWMAVLEKYPLSIVFPVYTGLLFAAVILLSGIFLHEPIGGTQLVGIALIFAGVAVASHA